MTEWAERNGPLGHHLQTKEPQIMRKTVNESTFNQEVIAGRAQMKKLIRLQGQPC